MTPGDPEDTDRWLRDALDDAVADVESPDDLDDIRARIEEDAMSTRTRQRWGAAAAGLAVAATVAAVALATGLEDPDEVGGPATSPSPSSASGASEPTGPSDEPEPTEPPDAAATPFDGPLAVYYVGDTPTGPRLFREFEAPPTATGDALALAVGMAVDRDPTDPDYRVPWPDGTEATASYDEEGALLTVDLSNADQADLRGRPAGMSDVEARMALEQLIHTAQAAVQDRAPVQFLLDGQRTDQLLGEPVSEPLAEGDPMQVQAPVWIIDPQDDTATNTLQVDGRGAFFEANVSWQLLQEGEVVREGFATAEECCTLSPYSFEIPDVPPGDYVLRVYDADMSGGEGPGEHEDTKRITITG